MTEKKGINWKLIGILFLVAAIAVGGVVYNKYQQIFSPNVPTNLSDNMLEIPTGTTYAELTKLLSNQGFLTDTSSFHWVAQQMSYDQATIRAGRFEVQPNWSNRRLIQHLRTGKQSTSKVVLTNERLPENVAAKVARFIEADSIELVTLFQDENYLDEIGYTKETLMSLFIPNTYDFYWNTTAKKFMERMLKEHKTFWEKDNRLAKAEEHEMTAEEVYTLASIVEKETNKNDEKERMAGVYMNRLRIGMPLQADPTAVFATRDFETRRVLNWHLEFESPYNTYLNKGLPPGPIAMASIASIDAVLNHEDHKYLYFCAKPNDSGYHSFAKTLTAHNVNAAKFRRWLTKRGY